MAMTNKDTAINKIAAEFEILSNLVLSQLDKMVYAFENYDEKNNDFVNSKLIKNEIKIDKFEVKLDDLIIQTIVLYKPMASDIRQLFAIYHMLTDMERIGDLVIKVAHGAQDINDKSLLLKSMPMLTKLMKLATKMVNRALISFLNHDKEEALWVINKDNSVDELNQKMLKKSMSDIISNEDLTSLVETLLELRSIISSIERIGDHATNIAEAAIYFIDGKIIRHLDDSKTDDMVN